VLIETAKKYVEAINAHDLERIASMYAPTVIYRSSGVGQHEGIPVIMDMMRVFFTEHPKLFGDISNYRILSPQIVTFDFSIILNGKTHTGVEHLTFDADGKIILVDVER